MEAYKFVEKLPEDLTCGICLSVLQKPQMVNCCEQCFCETCLVKWKTESKSCPTCRSTNFSHMLRQKVVNKIASLSLFCPNTDHGCKKTLTFKDYDHHLSQNNSGGCLYVKLPCPKSCGQDVFRADLSKHCNNSCPKRRVRCPHCQAWGEYQKMTDKHPSRCLRYPLPCPQHCKAIVAREDLQAHQKKCPLEPIQCPFSELGCTAELLRKDLEEHLTSAMATHLITLAISHMKLQEKHKVLKEDHANLKEDHAILKEEHKVLQTRSMEVESKLENAGVVVQILSGCIDYKIDHPLTTQVKQLSTILVNTSTVKDFGSSISLHLSSRIGRGSHYIIMDNCKFQLVWKYMLFNEIEVQLHLVEDREHSSLSRNWSCDFTVEQSTAVLVQGKNHNRSNSLFGTPTSGTLFTPDLSSTSLSPTELAVVCCGKSQSIAGISGTSVSSSSSGKQLLGMCRISTSGISDASLILKLQKHKRDYQQPPLSTPSSSDILGAQPYFTPMSQKLPSEDTEHQERSTRKCSCTCHKSPQKKPAGEYKYIY